ncbi:MAG TPA: DUF6599 family protein [Acidobacteriota bacterium]|nr:DUF6599 family protein [Acidobacteriota bacterium]
MADDQAQRGGPPASFVPSEALGWTAVEDRTFDAETIFEYIDGAGEVYRSYNMRALFARRFEKAGEPALVVDLFDMGTAADAFGVFTHDLDGEDAAMGQGSTYKGGLLSFWKGRYFASVYAEGETPGTKQAVFAVSAAIDRAIDSPGEKPALVLGLPVVGLNPRSVCYFHNHSVLNYHFFVADANILGLDQTTSAALASYGVGAERAVLLVVLYPDDGRASSGYDGFRKAYMSEASESAVVRTEDGKWTAAKREGRVVTIVFQAPDRDRAEGLLREASAGT